MQIEVALGNYSCMEQWKRILSLLFSCAAAAEARMQLFVKAIQMLKVQLEHVDEAEAPLFDLNEEGAAFVKGLLRGFRHGIRPMAWMDKAVLEDELRRLEDFLTQELDWDLDDRTPRSVWVELEDGEKVEIEMDRNGQDGERETGEYAPTVVGLSDEQLASLGS